jgi:hypothetical protein
VVKINIIQNFLKPQEILIKEEVLVIVADIKEKKNL